MALYMLFIIFVHNNGPVLELTGWLKNIATSSEMILASLKSIYQPISGKNTEAKVVALGAMTFEDAMNMVSQDTLLAA